MTTNPSILSEAADIVGGSRHADYGTPLDNHSRTAALWSAYLGIPVTARQVCMMNVLQKVSRDVHHSKRDNLVDIAGYAENANLCESPPKAPTVKDYLRELDVLAALDKAKAATAKSKADAAEEAYRAAMLAPSPLLADLPMKPHTGGYKAEFTTPLPPGVDVD